jgi:hypothetical protein
MHMYFAHWRQVKNFLIATLYLELSPSAFSVSRDMLRVLELVRSIIPFMPTLS